MTQHSILAPSGAGIWSHCGGYPMIAPMIPDQPTDDKRQGEATHWIGEGMLRNRLCDVSGYLGLQAPNGVIVTEEMTKCADIYARRVFRMVNPNETIEVERTMLAKRIHELCFGTPDVFQVVGNHIYLADYKHGHRSVDAFWNDQIIIYATEVMDAYGLHDDAVTVHAEIIQPRCYDHKGVVRGWKFKGSDIRGRVNQLHAAAADAVSGNAPFVPGTHCRDCDGKYLCPANQQYVAQAVDLAHSAAPIEITNERLGYEIRVLNDAEAAIKYRRESLEDEAMGRIRSGKQIGGVSIGHTRGSTDWIVPPETVFASGDALGVELRKPPTPITPGQAQKLCKDNADMLTPLFTKKPGRARIEIDDPTETFRVFSDSTYYLGEDDV